MEKLREVSKNTKKNTKDFINIFSRSLDKQVLLSKLSNDSDYKVFKYFKNVVE